MMVPTPGDRHKLLRPHVLITDIAMADDGIRQHARLHT